MRSALTERTDGLWSLLWGTTQVTMSEQLLVTPTSPKTVCRLTMALARTKPAASAAVGKGLASRLMYGPRVTGRSAPLLACSRIQRNSVLRAGSLRRSGSVRHPKSPERSQPKVPRTQRDDRTMQGACDLWREVAMTEEPRVVDCAVQCHARTWRTATIACTSAALVSRT
jgi:hypothetical protein